MGGASINGTETPRNCSCLDCPIHVLSAHSIEHQVETSPVSQPLLVALYRLFTVKNNIVCTQLLCQRCFFRSRHGSSHSRPKMLSYLNSNMPHPTGASMNQHMLTSLDFCALNKSSPSRQKHKRYRSTLSQRQFHRGRGLGKQRGIGHHEVCKCTRRALCPAC